MFDKLASARLVPAVVLHAIDDALPLCEALLAGGLDVIEVTFRSDVAAQAIARIRAELPDMLVGAGTILSTAQVEEAVDSGARFGVAPGLNPEVVEYAQERGLPFAPGVCTPSEIERAVGLGCRFMKFFPAEASGGVAFMKALAGPYVQTGVRFMPTGGLGPDTLSGYLGLPMLGAIGGSWMARPELIAAKDWSSVTRLTREAMSLIHGVEGRDD